MTLGGKMTADVLVGSIEYGNVLDVKYGNVLILIWLNDDSRRPGAWGISTCDTSDENKTHLEGLY
jgi:hypothetical protein